MRVAILTTGTRGDIQPFVALAAALRARGDDVRMTAPSDLLPQVLAAGADPVQLPFSAQEMLHGEIGRSFVDTGSVLAFARALREVGRLHRPALVDACLQAAQGADLLLVHPLLMGPGFVLARAHDIPLVRCLLGPMSATSTCPTPLMNLPSVGPLNRASHALVTVALGRMMAPAAQLTAQRSGVAAPRGNVIVLAEQQRTLALHLYSPVLQPRPRDWPGHHVITGMVTLARATRSQLGEHATPAPLQAWLQQGPAPVFFGFGSMPVLDPGRLLDVVERACAHLGVRALVGAGWSGLAQRPAAAQTLIAAAFDHDAILPMCRAAVHHGGMGTTHAALRAGLPALVCHFLADQPFWGRRLAALGVGARTPFRNLDVERLTTTLRPLLEPAVKQRAEHLGALLRPEDGVAQALVQIDQIGRSAPNGLW